MRAHPEMCEHPPRALVNPRPLATTAGPDYVLAADCLACGETVTERELLEAEAERWCRKLFGTIEAAIGRHPGKLTVR